MSSNDLQQSEQEHSFFEWPNLTYLLFIIPDTIVALKTKYTMPLAALNIILSVMWLKFVKSGSNSFLKMFETLISANALLMIGADVFGLVLSFYS